MYHDILLLKSAFLFFVLTNEWYLPLRVTMFFVFSKPLCSHFAAQIVIREFSAPLQKRCLSLSKGFPLQRETAKICYCCSQPLYSSFEALLEVILQRCSSAARFVRGQPPRFSNTKNWLGRDERWRLNPWLMMSFVQRILVDSDHHEFVMPEDARKRCSWQCNIWPDCFTSHQYYCLYYNMAIYSSLWENVQC